MATRVLSQKLVYLHCRSLFDGVNAQLRKEKPIRRILQAHKTSIPVLSRDFSLEVIYPVAKQLLEEGIFESTAKARLRFPELFETTTAQKSKRAASEAEVARSETKAIEKAVELSDKEGSSVKPTSAAEEKLPSKTQKSMANDVGVGVEKLEPATSLAPSLYPIYIPYALQHRILTSILSSVEESFFGFGKKWLPDIIASEGWEVPEQVELTAWTAKLKQHAKKIPTRATLKIPGKSWEEVLIGTHELRHSAVHRLKTSVYGLVNLIESAALLTRMLKDLPRAQLIEGIRDNLKSSIDEMEGHKKILQEKLSSELQSITQQRAELDTQEKMLFKGIVQSDIDNKLATGQRLTECLFLGGAGLQQSSSVLIRETHDILGDIEHVDDVLDKAQPSSNPKTAAKSNQNDHVTTSKRSSSLQPFFIHLPSTGSSEENLMVTESGPSLKAHQAENIKLQSKIDQEAKRVESEAEKSGVTIIADGDADKDELKASRNGDESPQLAIEGVREARALPKADGDGNSTNNFQGTTSDKSSSRPDEPKLEIRSPLTNFWHFFFPSMSKQPDEEKKI